MSKHTPGPWSHDADHPNTWHPKVKADPDVFAGSICEILSNINISASDPRMFEEMKANACLIAAAPDLLDALQMAVDAEKDLPGWLYSGRAAIAKATGGES